MINLRSNCYEKQILANIAGPQISAGNLANIGLEKYKKSKEEADKIREDLTQFETSNLGGGKFSTEEKCLEFLGRLVVERGGKGRGYKMMRSPFHYKTIMVEDRGDGYYTERHCILIE